MVKDVVEEKKEAHIKTLFARKVTRRIQK